MEIVFFCPPATIINGGIKYIFRMAEVLIQAGHQAFVLEDKERRPTWFSSTAPILGQAALKPNPTQIYVLPEDQTHMLTVFKDWPQKKVILSQNHFYSAYRLPDLETYAAYHVSDVICTSQAIFDHTRLRHEDVRAHIVPYSIDRELFHPGAKEDRIAFLPRKRPIEAAYLRDLFRALHPKYRHWQWTEISNVGEDDVAKAMASAKVFLSLSRLEGFGLTPLEAMASDCVVAGFTGIGGREYAQTDNGFWAQEDDFPACIDQIIAAIELAAHEGTARLSYREACQRALARYTPATFNAAVEATFTKILAA